MDMLRTPPDDALRRVVHDEVHARPMPLITLPARVLYEAVLHGADSSREQELAHLQTPSCKNRPPHHRDNETQTP